MKYVPLAPLDRALRDLEKAHADAAPRIQSLREALALRRARGVFDEGPYEHELNNILARTEFNADDIARLTARVLKEMP